jgi:hypothetical protein
MLFTLASNIFADNTSDEQNYDVFLGMGYYSSEEVDHDANYSWSKIKWRPFKLQENLRWGLFVSGAFGSGEMENGDYDWSREIGGLTAKISTIESSLDTDIDVGIGRLRSESSSNQGRYRSDQTDDILYFSVHSESIWRRSQGHKIFPKYAVDVELLLPYEKKQEHYWEDEALVPNEADNKRFELSVETMIYDINWSGLRLTPGIKTSFVKEYVADANFYQIGPLLAVSIDKKDIASFAIVYKEQMNGEESQWQATLFFDLARLFKLF